MPRLMYYNGTASWPQIPDATNLASYTSSPSTSTVCTPSKTNVPNSSTTFTFSGTVKFSASGSGAVGGGTVTIQKLVSGTWTNTTLTGITVNATTGVWGPSSTLTESASTSYRALYSGFSTTASASTSSTSTISFQTLTTFVNTYACTWSQGYEQAGGKITATTLIAQGSWWGGTYYQSLMGFPYATVQSDTSGGTITKVEVYLNSYSAYVSPTVIFCTHNATGKPGSVSANGASLNLANETFVAYSAATGGKWCNVAVQLGQRIQANTAKGIAIYAQSTATIYQMYGYQYGSSYPPQLRVTYTKYV